MSSPHTDPPAPPPALEEVAPGVFAYLQLHGQWGLNNAGFVLGPDGTTLIDTCFTQRRSEALRDAVQRTAGPDRPVTTLINTHHHGDHTHGNSVFAPPAAVIGHEKCREETIATGLGTTALWPYVDWGDLRVRAADVTFSDRLTVYAGDTRIELIYVGPAHTTNDIVAWLPEQRVLYAGDIIFNGGTPFILMGSLRGAIAAIDALRALGAETIVPGHGPVCGPEALDAVQGYLRWLQDLAREGHAAGVPPLDLARSADLGPYAAWHDRERLPANLHRAYAELNGEALGAPIPLTSVLPDMVAYNNGEMPKCLA
jgi:cyclase